MMVDVFAHGVSAGTTSIPSEGNNVLLLKNTLDIFDGFNEVHATACAGSIVSVLVVSSKVIAPGRGGYKGYEICCLQLDEAAGFLQYLTIGNFMK